MVCLIAARLRSAGRPSQVISREGPEFCRERMWRMRWFKVAAIGVGILIAFVVVNSVLGFIFKILFDVVIAALVVGAIAVAIKVASSRRQVSGKKAEREVREPDYQQRSKPLPRADVEPAPTPYPPRARPAAQDVDDDLARLKREMGG